MSKCDTSARRFIFVLQNLLVFDTIRPKRITLTDVNFVSSQLDASVLDWWLELELVADKEPKVVYKSMGVNRSAFPLRFWDVIKIVPKRDGNIGI